MPMVTQESRPAVGENVMNAGLTPPVLTPNGAGSW